MTAPAQARIYQTSDLAGATRREFINDAREGRAYLRTPDGESLVMLPSAELDTLGYFRDASIAYAMLDSALSRPRAERRAADFGAWAFISEMDDEDIASFHRNVTDAFIKALSASDPALLEQELTEWRRSAAAWSNPLTRSLIRGEFDPEDWIEAPPPAEIDG